jgi:hypothetical protein
VSEHAFAAPFDQARRNRRQGFLRLRHALARGATALKNMRMHAKLISWMALGGDGLVGLRGAMRATEVRAALGQVREGRLPKAHLQLLEHVPRAEVAEDASVACVLDHDRLKEVRVELRTQSASARQPLIDALTASLNEVGASQKPRTWVAGNTTFTLRATPASVLAEGMPIVITIEAQWPVSELPVAPEVRPVIALDWGFVLIDDGQGNATPAGARLGEPVDAWTARHKNYAGQRRSGNTYHDVLVTDLQVSDDGERVVGVMLSLSGKGDVLKDTLARWRADLIEKLGPAIAPDRHAFTWGGTPSQAVLSSTDFGGGEWALELRFQA